jgi:hypothetical protein
MMISRRPNTRASTENAPGPTPIIVTSIVKPNMSEILESKRLGMHAGNSESPTPTAPAATTAQTIGVRKPIKSIHPTAKAARPMSKTAGVRLGSPMYTSPSTSTVRPSTARNSSKATPGQPPGNAKNRRLSSFLPRLLLRS